jgi:hypothetical protein
MRQLRYFATKHPTLTYRRPHYPLKLAQIIRSQFSVVANLASVGSTPDLQFKGNGLRSFSRCCAVCFSQLTTAKLIRAAFR